MNKTDISTAIYHLELEVQEALKKFYKATGVTVEKLTAKKVHTSLRVEEVGDDGFVFSPVYEILTKFKSYL